MKIFKNNKRGTYSIKALSLAAFAGISLFATPLVGNAADIDVYSYNDINNHRLDFNNTYILKNNIENDWSQIKVGEGSSSSGAWMLDGQSHYIRGNWKQGFYISKNVTDFHLLNFMKSGDGSSDPYGLYQFSSDGRGGDVDGTVLYNEGTASISNTYIHDNYAKSGVVYNANDATLKILSSVVFQKNQANQNGNGAAIFNAGTIESIGNGTIFRENKTLTGQGGAIYNQGKIVTLGGDGAVKFGLKEDSASGNISNSDGGAIANIAGAEIENINNVEFNHNGVSSEGKNGGAIFNLGKISKIADSSFYKNGFGSDGKSNTSVGGAIYNSKRDENEKSGRIDEISNSTFENNASQYGGGAIFNDSNAVITAIDNVKFDSNSLIDSNQNGGAIYNKGIITTINKTSFNQNGASGDNKQLVSVGGAIFNDSNGNIVSIANSTFTGNESQYGGGAIFNKATISSISENSSFDANTSTKNGGGAIKNAEGGNIASITSTTFSNNRADGEDGKGGAIRNDGGNSKIETISGSEFYSNTSNDFGGAIANTGAGKITNITNTTFGAEDKINQGATGGAIINQNYSEIGSISGSTFTYNKALETTDYQQGNGGAIANFDNSTIKEISNSTFSYNEAAGLPNEAPDSQIHVYGGAIYNMNNSTINKIDNVTFDHNSVTAHKEDANYLGYAHGGAISNGDKYYTDKQEYNDSNSVIKSIENSTFTNNSVIGHGAYGGAIFNSERSKGIGKIVNSTFENNIASSVVEGGIALGGALYTEQDITLEADGEGKVLSFSGNQTNNNGKISNNAIFINFTSSDPNSGHDKKTITLNAINGGKIVFDDEIDGGNVINEQNDLVKNGLDYFLKIGGDSNSSVTLNNKVINADAILTDTNLTIGETSEGVSDVFADSTTAFTATSGTVNLLDNKFVTYNINKLVAEKSKWSLDVDWDNKESDKITIAGEPSDSFGTVYISGLNLIKADNNYTEDRTIQIIYGADGSTTESKLQLDVSGIDLRSTATGEPYFPDVNSNTIIGKYASIELGTTDTLNDSLTIKGEYYNTLEYIAGLVTTDGAPKTFTFVDEMPVYSYNKNSLEFVGDLTIKGSSRENNYIDFNEATNLSIVEGASVTLDTSAIANAPSIINKGSLAAMNAKFDAIDLIENDGTLSLTSTEVAAVKELNNNGEAVFNNSIFHNTDGVIRNNENATMDFVKSEINGTVENNANMTITASEVKGKLTNNPNAELKISGSAIENTLSNDGYIIIEGTTALNSEITGNSGGVIELTSGKNVINNKISAQEIVNSGATIDIPNISVISNNNNSLVMKDGVVNIPSLGLNSLVLNQLNMQGGAINISSVDVDLANEVMGSISAPISAPPTGGVINVNGMRLISDSKDDVTEINFASGAFASAVKSNVNEAFTATNRYDVTYSGSTGNFSFSKGSGYNAYNPAIFASSVATQTGGYMTELMTVDYSFYHIDTWGMLPQKARLAEETANKYAITEGAAPYQDNSNSGIWYRPYTSFESVNLNNGPDVDVISYGTLIGGDSDFKDLGHGWRSVISAFAGYNGSSQSYSGQSIYQNGGVLGATASFYKGNFFTGITANVGASVGETNTIFGHDTFSMLMSGIASRTGYNFETKNGRFTIQPNMLIGYSFVNTFDYTNAAGAKVDSDPLHAIQLAPRVKFITNLENGWQPYASVGMVWNIMDKTNVKVYDVSLPRYGMGPYVEYGLGLQRRWAEDNKYSAYGQAMVRNGSRNGVSLSFGFKMLFGKGAVKEVNGSTTEKTVIKTAQRKSKVCNK